MNKLSFYLLTLLTLILTACGASNGLQPVSTATDGTLSIETQLILGTLKLDGTEQTVTSDQANELLVMWQVYQELNSSNTAAQAEIDGLVEQIQETMTASQMQAITEMNLTQSDILAAIQAQSITASNSGQISSFSGVSFTPPDGSMADGGAPPDGGMGGDAPPDGGMGDMVGMAGAGPGTSIGQSQDTGASPDSGSSAGVPTILIDALIQYLEQMASF
jgi:hypothetical protein